METYSQWKESSVTEAWVKSMLDTRSHGIYSGFGVQAAAGLSFDVINYDGRSVAMAKQNDVVIAIHNSATVNVVVAPSASTQYLVIDAPFIVGSDTNAVFAIVTSVESHHVVLCALNVPLLTTDVDVSMIDYAPRQWCKEIQKEIILKKQRIVEYGSQYFIDDGFKIEGTEPNWNVKAGSGFCNGVFVSLDQDQSNISYTANGDVYLDTAIAPRATEAMHRMTLETGASAPADYVDAFGLTHTITVLGQHEDTGNTFSDNRQTGSGQLRAPSGFVYIHPVKEVRDIAAYVSDFADPGVFISEIAYLVTPKVAGHHMKLTWDLLYEAHWDSSFAAFRDILDGNGYQLLPNAITSDITDYKDATAVGMYDGGDAATTPTPQTITITDHSCVATPTLYILSWRTPGSGDSFALNTSINAGYKTGMTSIQGIESAP